MDGALDRHVVLVGFMGAGKTMVGGHVARQLGRPFVDVDEAIAAGHGPIAELFAEQGEAAFREVEARFVREALARPEPTVIAVGGGAVETPGLLHDDRATVVHLHSVGRWLRPARKRSLQGFLALRLGYVLMARSLLSLSSSLKL